MSSFPFKGILLAAISGLSTSSSGAVIKWLTGLHPLEIVIYRTGIQLVVSLVVVFIDGVSILGHPSERKYLFLRAFLGSMGLMSFYCAIRLTSLGDAGAIFESYPPFITFLAWMLLGEPFGWFYGMANVLTIAGILVISGPRFLTSLIGAEVKGDYMATDSSGLALALFGCIVKTCGNLSIRYIKKTPAAVVVIWFSVMCGALSAIFVPILDEFHVPQRADWPLLFTIGLLGLVTQYAITTALKLEQAAPVAITEALSMVIGFLYQVHLFQEPMTVRSICGATFISLAIALVSLKKLFEVNKDKISETTTV